MPRSGYDRVGGHEETKMEMAKMAPLEMTMPRQLPAEGRATGGKKALAGSAVALVLCLGLVATNMSPAVERGGAPGSSALGGKAKFDSKGRSVLPDFDLAPTFADFLPALGGEYGTPMWAFFANRAQGVTSYGTANKDTAIMEFNSANKAYEYVAFDGFRTFVKGTRAGSLTGGGQSFQKEVFGGNDKDRAGVEKRDMYIGMNELEIEEVDAAHGLATNVLYFTLPGEQFNGIVRRTTFKNTGTTALDLEVLDGQAKLEPAGVNDWNLKNMGRTTEAWMNVYNMKESENTAPFYKLSLDMADTAEVTQVVEGHWAIAFVEGADASDDAAVADDDASEAAQDLAAAQEARLPFLVDPVVVFGKTTSFAYPTSFAAATDFDAFTTGPQVTTSKTPCAFAAAKLHLAPGAAATVTSVYGRAVSQAQYDDVIKHRVAEVGYVARKYLEAAALAKRLTDKVAMKSGIPVFDMYVRQQYLDNFLRGGYPVVLGDAVDPKVFHTFSRIHGDMERDYNYFQIDACFFSMGPGNFRDVHQNRRCDVYQEPKVGAYDVATFLSFVQADGYNPLTVNSAFFVLPDAEVPPAVSGSLNATSVASAAAASASPTAWALATAATANPKFQKIVAVLLSNANGFRPGDLFIALGVNRVQLDVTNEAFINAVAAAATLEPNAVFPGLASQNGFWADHWTYHMDLVEAYLAVFPDQEAAFLFGPLATTPFVMSPVTCTPRARKYVFAPGLGPRQYNFIDLDAEKQAAMTEAGAAKPTDYSWQRVSKAHGGGVFQVPLFVKLLMLGVTRFTLLDPLGLGVDYEGGKPGWNDAMNGLCGLFGSGMPEAFEAARIFKFLGAVAAAHPHETVEVPEEMDALMGAAQAQLAQYNAGSLTDFEYWDTVRTHVDLYRAAVRVTFSGKTVAWSLGTQVAPLCAAVVAKFAAGAAKAQALHTKLTGDTTMPTYWIYHVDNYEALDGEDALGRKYVKPLSFTPQTVPLFLEGPTRFMKVAEGVEAQRAVYQSVKASEMYDKKLGMFKICAPLDGMSFEVGRMMAFAPGWLENESIWLHMSYKFYLQLLRGGLYAEFFAELATGLVAFMDPDVYGRSPLESSSFLASSAHPDPSLHGQGFLARLSGSTAEFLSMWNFMMLGAAPFSVAAASGDLELTLQPVLPGDWFDDHGEVSFAFLGHTPAVYHNPTGRDTWDPKLRAARLQVTLADGSAHEIQGGTVPAPYAGLARSGVAKIDVYFEEEADDSAAAVSA